VESDWARRELGGTFFDDVSGYKSTKKNPIVLPANPDYQALADCEKLVVRSRKDGLRTYVVNAGLLYGRGEGDLMHGFFKDAWELAACPFPWDPTQPLPTQDELDAVKAAEEENANRKKAAEEADPPEEWEAVSVPKLRQRGENMVPTIHVEDLAAVTTNLVAAFPGPTSSYIIAVDRSRLSMSALLGSLSKELGTGAMAELTEVETVQLPGIEKLQVDLVAQQSQDLKALLKWSKWRCRSGPVANIEMVLNDYRAAAKPAPRGVGSNTMPLKVFLFGPPGLAGNLAAALSKKYKVRVLETATVITEALALEPKKFGKAVRRAAKKTEGRLPDKILVEMYRRVLTTQPCKNQGFILNGFPKTYTQAKWLTQGWKEHEPAEGEEEPPAEADPDYTYGYTRPPVDPDAPPEEEEEEEEEDPAPEGNEEEDEEAREKRLAAELARVNAQCTAEWVFELSASNDTVETLAAQIPEGGLRAGHDDEAGLGRRLALYRGANKPGLDTAVGAYADLKLAVNQVSMDGEDTLQALEDVSMICGQPRNYGLTDAEKKAIADAKAAKEKQEADAAALEKQLKEKTEAEAAKRKSEEENAKKELIANMDESQLLRAAVPLRKYLEGSVMSVIRKGLIECAEVRPNDPIDYLAEYLLENNTVVE